MSEDDSFEPRLGRTGQNLVIARDYIAHGIRARLVELLDGDLGPRSTLEIESRLRHDVQAERVTAILRRSVDLASGRFALIQKSREFNLVPWRPVLEKQIGKQVTGVMRGEGISWAIGRGRNGPEIS
jgi:hypothetical protein